MNRHLIFVSALLYLLLVGCKGEPAKDGTADKTKNSKQRPAEDSILNQIPAAEMLGSKVLRNLRYQPDTEVAELMGDSDELLEYIRKIGLSFRREIGQLKPEKPMVGTVIVGINAQHESRLWYVFPDGYPSAEFRAQMIAGVQAVQQPTIKKGLIVFGVVLALWNYQAIGPEVDKIELPKEWIEAGKKFKTPQKASKLAEICWNAPLL